MSALGTKRFGRSSRSLRVARRGLLTATAVGGLLLAGSAPLAGAAEIPVPPTVPTILGLGSPLGSTPVVGGFTDSVLGIATGTYYGIVGATSAVVCPILTPICSSVPTG
jgi:hypothetical protein